MCFAENPPIRVRVLFIIYVREKNDAPRVTIRSLVVAPIATPSRSRSWIEISGSEEGKLASELDDEEEDEEEEEEEENQVAL